VVRCAQNVDVRFRTDQLARSSYTTNIEIAFTSSYILYMVIRRRWMQSVLLVSFFVFLHSAILAFCIYEWVCDVPFSKVT